MIIGVPISLIVVYALYRLVEYFAGVRQRQLMAEQQPLDEFRAVGVPYRGPRMALAILLGPARVFGWGFLLYYGWRDGWIEPVKLAAVAFPVSLVMQSVVTMLGVRAMTTTVTLLTLSSFVVLPTCAALMFFFLPT
jgi:hypothetical protein